MRIRVKAIFRSVILSVLSGTTLIFTIVETPGKDKNQEPAATIFGELKCEIAGGGNFVPGSTEDLECIYEPSPVGDTHFYKGKIRQAIPNKIFPEASVILWKVLAHAEPNVPGMLSGNYYDPQAKAGDPLGETSVMLISPKKIILIPEFAELNIAAGIISLELSAL